MSEPGKPTVSWSRDHSVSGVELWRVTCIAQFRRFYVWCEPEKLEEVVLGMLNNKVLADRNQAAARTQALVDAGLIIGD
jgi:hypothetical protein